MTPILTKTKRRLLLLCMTAAFMLPISHGFSVIPSSPSIRQTTTATRSSRTTRTVLLQALPSSSSASKKSSSDRTTKLSAVAIGSSLTRSSKSSSSSIRSIVEAALLVTGSTVGASCLVLPDTVAGPGLLPSIGIFGLCYVYNIISGLALAGVAIAQYESSGTQVPSSFQEFGSETLSPQAGKCISALSIFVNACVVSFDFVRAGSVGSDLLLVNNVVPVSILFATMIATLVATQSSKQLSSIASIAVLILFVSFGALLLPGMAHIQDPIGTLLTPGTAMSSSDNLLDAVWHAAPVLLLTMVYQNIVPSVVKILNYNRKDVTAALVLGSLLPMLMYIAWCWTVLGGGTAAAGAGEEPSTLLMQVFSMAAVTGSALGCTMSIAEELDSNMKVVAMIPADTNPQQQEKKDMDDDDSSLFGLPSVLLSVAIPLAAGLAWSGGKDFDDALRVAGAYGDPILYGAIPVVMAYTQQQQQNRPWLITLGMGSFVFLGQEIMTSTNNLLY